MHQQSWAVLRRSLSGAQANVPHLLYLMLMFKQAQPQWYNAFHGYQVGANLTAQFAAAVRSQLPGQCTTYGMYSLHAPGPCSYPPQHADLSAHMYTTTTTRNVIMS